MVPPGYPAGNMRHTRNPGTLQADGKGLQCAGIRCRIADVDALVEVLVEHVPPGVCPGSTQFYRRRILHIRDTELGKSHRSFGHPVTDL